jgi:hypothetical protein
VVQALGSEGVQTTFRKQMIKPVPSASLDEARTWSAAEVGYWKQLAADVKVELPDN